MIPPLGALRRLTWRIFTKVALVVFPDIGDARHMLFGGEDTVSESERNQRARAMTDCIDDLLKFADDEEDFLLGAKLAEIRGMLVDRYTDWK